VPCPVLGLSTRWWTHIRPRICRIQGQRHVIAVVTNRLDALTGPATSGPLPVLRYLKSWPLDVFNPPDRLHLARSGSTFSGIVVMHVHSLVNYSELHAKTPSGTEPVRHFKIQDSGRGFDTLRGCKRGGRYLEFPARSSRVPEPSRPFQST
jgi:hypothetical protein